VCRSVCAFTRARGARAMMCVSVRPCVRMVYSVRPCVRMRVEAGGWIDRWYVDGNRSMLCRWYV
jgi:hypothetical protein